MQNKREHGTHLVYQEETDNFNFVNLAPFWADPDYQRIA